MSVALKRERCGQSPNFFIQMLPDGLTKPLQLTQKYEEAS